MTSGGIRRQHGDRRCFDATGRGPRGAADQHQGDRHRPPCASQRSQVGRIKSGRPRRHRLEQGEADSRSFRGPARKNPTKKTSSVGTRISQAVVVRIDLGLHPVPLEAEAVSIDVLPGQETDAADDDQQADRNARRPMCAEGRQGRIVPRLATHDIESRVAEGGDRMEDGHPDAGAPVGGAECGHHQAKGAEQLREHGRWQMKRTMFSSRHRPPGGRKCSPAGGCAAAEKSFSRRRCDEGRDCDDAQTADLDQDQNDRLSEEGPVDRRILDHQTGHAHRGSRR